MKRSNRHPLAVLGCGISLELAEQLLLLVHQPALAIRLLLGETRIGRLVGHS